MPAILPRKLNAFIDVFQPRAPIHETTENFAGIMLGIRSENATTPSTGGGIMSYTHGLTGVELVLDQELIGYLWWSIWILIIAVLLGRIAQLVNNHFRHLNALTTSTTQQNYWRYDKTILWPWFKKYVLYAPLWKKRHNREFRFSEAVNMGTLPSRFHTVLLLLYLISNLSYTLILDYSNPNKHAVLAELRGRSGILATVNMVPLVLLAGRNNPLIPLLKVNFDTYNLIHRWLGRLVALETVIHTCAWAANNFMAQGFSASMKSISGNTFLVFGTMGTVCMVLIMFQACSVVRHAFYETFLHIHQLLAILAILGVYVHLEVAKLPAFPYIRLAVVFWASERLWRLGRIIYLNVSRRDGLTKVRVEALPGEACRVTFYLPRHVTIRPGSHVYAYLPQISFWMSHPFSVAWTDTTSEPPTGMLTPIPLTNSSPLTPSSIEKQFHPQSPLSQSFKALPKTPTTVSLIMSARTGMTRQLLNAALKSPSHTLQMSGALEGPYAGHDSLRSYGTVILFAGGAGITHHLIQIRHLLASSVAGTVATQHIVLVWSVKSVEMLSWVRPWMDEILGMEGRRERLSVKLFVTKPKSPREVVSPSQTVQMFPGRCQPGKVLDQEWAERVGSIGVSVCGPGAFADEVRGAVRERIGWGTVDFLEEAFTW